MNQYFNGPVNSTRQVVSAEIIRGFEESTGIGFSSESQVQEPNLCFVDSDELRDEYKTRFTHADILNYIFAMRHSSSCAINENVLTGIVTSIPYPKNNLTFWKLARLGKELKCVQSGDTTLANELIKAINEVGK